MASIFDVLDEIRKRPGMYIGYDESKRAWQLQHLELIISGYSIALYNHNIKEPGLDFNHEFATYLYETKGWSASCGPVAAIREAAKSDEGAWVLYWKMVDKFRSTIEAA